ncbi:hypothetical protein LLEC1_04669, partial [Akanthomyces lecanii]
MAPTGESSPLLPSEPAIERYSPVYEEVKTMPEEQGALFDTTDILRDVIIGFSDGLTVPFALTAGLSSLGSSKIVIMGGLAELFSGMISMGLGAYLAAVTERDHYASQEERERRNVDAMPEARRAEVYAILERYAVSRAAAQPLVDDLCRSRAHWARL